MTNTPGHRQISDDEADIIRHIKALEAEFLAFLTTVGASREMSLARTKMQEASFWATKHIAENGYPAGRHSL